MKDKAKLLQTAIQASIDAGRKILEIYQKDFKVEFKEDESPLTVADTASNDVINTYLEPLGIPILSEEGKAIHYDTRKTWNRLWIVDPLDGTKEFIKRNGEFTVNIALVENGVPVMGVIYIPVHDTLYFASGPTGSIKVENVSTLSPDADLDLFLNKGRPLPIALSLSKGSALRPKPYAIVGSKSHMTPETEKFINELKSQHGEVEILSRGSSLKICMVAEGTADIYPRFAPTMEWDVAAGHAIVRFAGGRMEDADTGEELGYNKADLVNSWFVVRRG